MIYHIEDQNETVSCLAKTLANLHDMRTKSRSVFAISAAEFVQPKSYGIVLLSTIGTFDRSAFPLSVRTNTTPKSQDGKFCDLDSTQDRKKEKEAD